MATGIISVDAIQVGSEQIGLALLAINITAWLLLWLTGFIRAFLGPRALLRDLGRHETGPGFLTVTAGTAVLGSQFAAVQLAPWIVVPLFALSIALWAITQYGFLAGVSEGGAKPPLNRASPVSGSCWSSPRKPWPH
jgi:hypothetical protein